MILRHATWALAAYLALAFSAHAQSGSYLADLPKAYPAAYSLWRQSLPYAIGKLPDWLAKLGGVTTPILDVTIRGTRMKFGTTCVPHDCGNQAAILFTPQQDRVVGVVLLSSQTELEKTVMIVGKMTNDEYACIRRFLANPGLTAC